MPEKNQEAVVMTPGNMLKTAREALDLTQSDIAKRTRLSLHAIEDLENNDYTNFGATIFVRGYLRSYARLVNITDEKIMETLDASDLIEKASYTESVAIEGAPVMNVTRPQSQAKYSRMAQITICAGILLVISIFIGWRDQESAVKKDIKNKSPSITLNQPQSIAFVAQPAVNATAQTVATADKNSVVADASQKPVDASIVKPFKKVAKANKKKSTAELQPTYTLSPVTETKSS